ESELAAALDSLPAMRELVAAAGADHIDADIFWEAAERVLENPNQSHPPFSAICGAIAGLLYSGGRMEQARLNSLVAGYLVGVPDSQKRVGFLHGLLKTCREAAWQNVELMRSLDGIIADWDEAEFVSALPSLRLALAELTPRETDRVAGVVAGLHGKKELGELAHYHLTERELELNRRVTAVVLQALKTDGLSHWLEGGSE